MSLPRRSSDADRAIAVGGNSSTALLPRGPLMLGIEGLSLTDADRVRLAHPTVGGVILFSRNYADPDQLGALTEAIANARDPALLVGVDHEGGRVQRFRAGFTPIPPMRTVGTLWATDRAAARAEARTIGATIARELVTHGIDFSFTPVLDLDHGQSEIIGDRAFHSDPDIVAALAEALVGGLREGGVASVGKHFPGHGFVAADSHFDLPVDDRSLDELLVTDIAPFAHLAGGTLDAIMPAHVVYPQVDSRPAGFSRVWIEDILRGRLGFDGLVFSDDLEMAGAHAVGDIVARADAALAAGCDMVLACNDFTAMDDLLRRWIPADNPALARRAAAMRARRAD